MSEQNETKKHLNLQKAYNLSSPEDNVDFYRGWAEDYDTDFAGGMDYILPCHVATQFIKFNGCLLYTSPSPRDMRRSRMPSSA